MSVAIMQPTYLPWAGYFNLISRVSRFVFLDDVQFAKPSWQMRNRILHRGAPHFLSVPTAGSRYQPLCDVRLSGEAFRDTHQKTLQHAYGKHPYGAELLECVLPVLGDRALDKLVELNVALIEVFCRALGLTTPLLRSTQLGVRGKRSSHLLEILEALGESDYLSPEGSRGYIDEEQVLASSGVSVRYQNFAPIPYAQRGTSDFVSHLSLADVVAHLGWAEARRYVSEPEAFSNELSQISRAVSGEGSALFLDHAATDRALG